MIPFGVFLRVRFYLREGTVSLASHLRQSLALFAFSVETIHVIDIGRVTVRSSRSNRGTVLYPTLPYPTLPYPTLPYPTLPYPTLPYPTLPYPTLPYPNLLYPTLLYPTVPYITVPYRTVPYRTVPYPALLCSVLFYCQLLRKKSISGYMRDHQTILST